MDWTASPGQPRPVEQDAFRLLAVLHAFGIHSADAPPYLVGESLLRRLDQLVREPVTLAHVLTDRISRHPDGPAVRGRYVRRVRRLIYGVGKRRPAPAGRPLYPFNPPAWERWDDTLAFLTCRGLLTVRSDDGGEDGTGPRVLYGLTARGVEQLVAAESVLAPYRERCQLLDELLVGSLLGEGDPEHHLERYLESLGRRLARFRHDEQLSPADDLFGQLFQNTFGEPL